MARIREWVFAGAVGLLLALPGVLVRESWLPWFVVLDATLVLFCGAMVVAKWVELVGQSKKYPELAQFASKLTPFASKLTKFRGVLITLAVVFIISLGVTRVFIFDTISLEKASLPPALPGDDIIIAGGGLPENHPKILTIALEPKNTSDPEPCTPAIPPVLALRSTAALRPLRHPGPY